MPTTRRSTPGIPLGAIAALSAAAIAYEVLLTRLLSIIQWHHFSYMIISLALLGYGISGSFLMLLGEWLRQRFITFLLLNAALFGVTAMGGFILAQQLPLNPLEIAWDARQPLYLLAWYLLLAIPFLCVANCIGAAFICCQGQVHRIYAFDMVGAGAGALGIIVLLFLVTPTIALVAVAVLGLVAATLATLQQRTGRRAMLVLLGVMILTLVLMPASWRTLKPSIYKDLNQALEIVGAERLVERSSPLGAVSVVGNRQVPFRQAPGLSLAAGVGPPEQLAVFSDGNAAGTITRFSGQPDELRYLDHLTSALPYQLLSHPHVLVLGAGGGSDVLQALHYQARLVQAVELNPQIVALVRSEFSDFAGHLYQRADVQVSLGEARGFVAGSQSRYDLIQIAMLDAFSTAAAGLYALNESYLYTVEAFEEYLQHLTPGGMLAITRWLRLPPRDSLKLFATAVTALERLGFRDPGNRIVLIRGWNTSTLVIKNGYFDAPAIRVLKNFCRDRSFDLAHYPGITATEANRFNLLQQPYLYDGTQAILGAQRERFFERYKFDVTPATDDRPFFFHFAKLGVLPELFSVRFQGGFAQLEWGYIMLLATLVQAVVAGALLILLPLGLTRGRALTAPIGGLRWRVLGFFLLIGLGFLFLEIAFIQKFVLFLSHPLYAVAVVLCAFLVFAGLGSAYSRRLDAAHQHRRLSRNALLGIPLAGIAVLSMVYLLVLPSLFAWALPWYTPVKVACTVLLIAPLAFCMGMPFPTGLAWVSETAPELIPWAWAINGCASVVSAVLATLLAVALGFANVILLAIVLYLLAGVVAPRPTSTHQGGNRR